MSDLQVSISTVKTINLGDHGERQTFVHEYVQGETVEDLVKRVLPHVFNTFSHPDAVSDKIVLKVVIGADGLVTGLPTTAAAPAPGF